ncbi:MAG TPA: DUF2975 domain-containing protein [Candidatus Rubrimentiphilum sp.]|nr:DUF2975 domain-containing protein [Candidatus Rubrimentiphilum sp.]
MPKTALPVTALVIRIVVLGLALALFFEQLGARHLLHLDGSDGRFMTTPVYWVSLLAPIFYLAALKAASDALVRMDRGDAFGPAAVRALKEIGGCLMLGAFIAIIVQPSLIFLIGNGWSEMQGVKFDLTIENLTIALIGLVLILLARQGQQLQSQLDQFV